MLSAPRVRLGEIEPMTPCKAGNAKTDRASATAEQVAPAMYVNYFEIGHNPFEFLMDLGQYHPGSTDVDGRVAIHTRIAIAPPYAKMLSALLSRSVEEHERQHGPIALIGPQSNPFDIVLSSLGDFEDRARALRALRARERGDPPADGNDHPATGEVSSKRIRSRRGR
jgi:hypothetical protein